MIVYISWPLYIDILMCHRLYIFWILDVVWKYCTAYQCMFLSSFQWILNCVSVIHLWYMITIWNFIQFNYCEISGNFDPNRHQGQLTDLRWLITWSKSQICSFSWSNQPITSRLISIEFCYLLPHLPTLNCALQAHPIIWNEFVKFTVQQHLGFD